MRKQCFDKSVDTMCKQEEKEEYKISIFPNQINTITICQVVNLTCFCVLVATCKWFRISLCFSTSKAQNDIFFIKGKQLYL
jgi:hypothetical protein